MDRVAEAMRAVARQEFLPPTQRERAGLDVPLGIGHGATCSQPSTVAETLRLLDARPGHAVLDVGSGSGWTAALLDHLVTPGGTVVGVELDPALVSFARRNLTAFLGDLAPRVEQAVPRRLGWPDDGPYDRILVSAEALDVPETLVAQLADDGRMVIPVRGRMTVVDREGDGLRIEQSGAYTFVPLREE
ncbi:protein-L-isoaspartate(D-aspartate) O-methyltransferase [Flavimobilis soli]|uniref:Protein-L-isoaspartate O-methyltransferase n=1 Tax=Flavimobilis soli TaxID=442709 RepID=A0A2A9EF21_9MICO|nr:protein-L-isoaspartate O-methyltransferase [Flavimobilis soli]PFG36819.1 protein-L-isoaspartate(D-aspartate) O-methyltransferase [Flavimobilis soli]